MATTKTGLREDVVQAHVAGICALLGLAHYHTKDSRGSDRGFLDSFVIGPGGPTVIECKDDTGKTTAEQDLWTWLFTNVMNIPVLLVRPEDTRPRADLGGKTLIQVELEKISRGPGGERFPPDIARAIVAARKAAVRQGLAAIKRATARRGR